MKKILLVFVSLITAISSYAHALWIETNAEAKIGVPHEVKVYYGEYGEGIHEETEGKFKDMKDFTLWLVMPDKQRVKLECKAEKDCFTATFTPQQEGVYAVLMENETLPTVDTKGNYGVLKPMFYASATIIAKGTKTNDTTYNNQSLHIFSDIAKKYKTGDNCTVSVVLNGQPLANEEITVYSPAGWGKVLTTDAAGKASFPAIWAGRYVVEAVKLEKLADNAKGYNSTRQVATYALQIGK